MNDGGPAFPSLFGVIPPNLTTAHPIAVGGMSLRDWFAGMALVMDVFASRVEDLPDDSPFVPAMDRGMYDTLASRAYSFADAMLAARDRGADGLPHLEHEDDDD